MATLVDGPVLAGVDGSAGGWAALDWAAAEAAVRDRELHLVHALGTDPLRRPGPRGDASTETGEALLGPDAVLEQARGRAEARAPGVRVTTEIVAGRAGPALVRRSREAGLVVTGARGLRGVVGSLVGSVSLQVAMHGACPAVVVRELPDRDRRDPTDAPRIVVGLDGSSGSMPALEFALHQADLHGVGLTVVHAWWLEVVSGAPVPAIPSDSWDRLADEQQSVVSEALVGWREKFPDVKVREHVLQAHPVEALIDHSVGAELVVVGSRGLGGFSGLLLGSVSHGVLQRALCPVAVVREPPEERDDR